MDTELKSGRRLKASVLVITYNQESTIARAIESLLMQKCEYDWEIILADDASEDSTRKICEEYALRYPERIRVMPEAPNKGLVGNYFDAFEAAGGDYIGDCAGDDEWLDVTRLQRQIEMLDADPSLSVCYCDVEVAEEGKSRYLFSDVEERRRWMRDRVSGSELLADTLNHVTALPYMLSAALYRKSSIEALYRDHRDMIRDESCGVEDVGLLAALASAGDGAYIPICGMRYYIGGESASNNLSYEREYRFYSRILRLTRKLAEFYGTDICKLTDHFNSKISHIASQVAIPGGRNLGATSETSPGYGGAPCL